MKKILLLFTLLLTVSMYASAKNFYYKGISLEYKKGKLTGTGDESKSINVTGTIGIASFSISAEKLKYEESDTDAVTTYLDEVRTNIENMEGSLRIERTNDIKDGTLNGIEGQQFDIIYRKKKHEVWTTHFLLHTERLASQYHIHLYRQSSQRKRVYLYLQDL